MYPSIPDMDHLLPEDIETADVVDYLNSVIAKYGSPCQFCNHFLNLYCDINHRPRNYQLRFGPYDVWTIRKHCKDLAGNDGTENKNDEIGHKTNMALDCNFQQYCHKEGR